MKRIITVVLCLATLSLVALAFWAYVNRMWRKSIFTAESGTITNQLNSEQSFSSTAMDLQLFELPVRVAFWGDDQFSPCYFSQENNTLYRWNGINLHSEQVPSVYSRVPSGMRILQAKQLALSVVPIEAPVKYWYWEDGEGYRPGYLDRSSRVFFAWNGVVLNKQELLDERKDGRNAVVKPTVFRQVIEIDMPVHLRGHPELWKKGGAYTPEVSIRAEKRAAEKKATERRALEERARDPRVFTLLVRVTSFGENEFSPCYYDPKNRSLYRWKDVVLRLEQVPNEYRERKIVMLIPAGLSVEPVEAPVNYREVNGEYRPGFLDRSIGVFYEWKGVMLSKQEVPDKSKDGQDAIVKPAAFSRVTEIDMPAYLKDKPKLWKKS